MRKLEQKVAKFARTLETVDAIAEHAEVADSFYEALCRLDIYLSKDREYSRLAEIRKLFAERYSFDRYLLDEVSRKIIDAMARAGWFRFLVGPRVDVRALSIIRRGLSMRSSLADALFALQGLGSYPIVLAGNASQKRKYLKKVAAGKLIPAYALTEPGAGSDIGGTETSFQKVKGGYAIKGVKTFISNAGIADFFVVFTSKAKTITAFIVDSDTKGVKIKRQQVIAPHPIGEVHFDCVVPASARLGKEGQGYDIAVDTLGVFRTTVGAAALGMATRAYEEAINVCKTRVRFGKPLAEYQGVRFMLADMAVKLRTIEQIVFGAGRSKLDASMAKLHATETAQQIIDTAVQLHGGSGVVKGSVVEKLYREIRSLRIYEGTSEIQKLVIAKEILK